MAETTRGPSAEIDTLADRVHGPVHLPETAGYDRQTTGFQLLDPHRPAVVVDAAGDHDVRTAVEFAAAHGMPIAVQASGHGRADALDGGVLINTRGMCGVQVDPAERTAWVAAGATWQQVVTAAARHGLAPLSGSSPGVGAVSYTLGSGVGLLARRYGFAADHVRRIDLVTADGHAHRVTADDEPDLFWALRGAGGNLGVVTGILIDLMPVASIFGGGLYVDVDQVPEVLDGWRSWTATVPDEMTSAVSMLPFPDLPMVPEQLRGRHVAQLQICYLGSADDGQRLVEPLRMLGPILRDTLRQRPYTESGSVFDEPDQPHAYRSDNLLVDGLDRQALATLSSLAGPSAPVMCVVGLRHLGGALARPPRIANAVGHRDAQYSVTVLSPVQPGEQDTVRATHRAALRPCAPHAVGRSLNFSYGPVEADQIRSAFAPADYRRLTELAARHDPDRLIACNHPIRPRPGTAGVPG